VQPSCEEYAPKSSHTSPFSGYSATFTESLASWNPQATAAAAAVTAGYSEPEPGSG